MISAIQSAGNGYGHAATQSRTNAVYGGSTAGASASSQVTISAAAREAARNGPDAGLKLPDYVAGWFNKDFSQDVLDEAKARLADRRVDGELGAGGPMMLPLLPENQALLDGFRREMKGIRAAGWENATPAQSERVNLLTNMSARLLMVGWQKPMTEADVQREFDISSAMAKLSVNDPVPAPAEDPHAIDPNAAEDMRKTIADQRAGAVPGAWRQRWEEQGLVMPTKVTLSPERAMWLDLANAAGIGDDEFVSTLRDMAVSLKGNALTRAMETFISERYVALTEAQEASRRATASS